MNTLITTATVSRPKDFSHKPLAEIESVRWKRQVATRTNEKLVQMLEVDASGSIDVASLLLVIRREMGSGQEATRLKALRWVATLQTVSRGSVLAEQAPMVAALMDTFSDECDQVVEQALEVLAGLAAEETHFQMMMKSVLERFRVSPSLLEQRGSLIVRRLCRLLGSQRVYCQFATILEAEENLPFAQGAVQALNLILLTSPETVELCQLLRQSLQNTQGRELLALLYGSWCHCAVATVSLCLLSQAYAHACGLIVAIGDGVIDVEILVQTDQLVQLLESPVFTFLRLQLTEPTRCPYLVKSLYGILMLLPQSPAFHLLQTRLHCVGNLLTLHTAAETAHFPDGGTNHNRNKAVGKRTADAVPEVNFNEMLKQFHDTRRRHQEYNENDRASNHGGPSRHEGPCSNIAMSSIQ